MVGGLNTISPSILCSFNPYLSMNVVFFDPLNQREALKPFTLTRPVAGLRVGILTLEEKWQKRWEATVPVLSTSYLTEAYLQRKYPLIATKETVLINAAVCPTDALVRQVRALYSGQAIRDKDTFVAAYLSEKDASYLMRSSLPPDYPTVVKAIQDAMVSYELIVSEEDIVSVNHPWDIFTYNADQIQLDYELITQRRTSHQITDPYTRLYRPDRIFVEEGATIRAAIINAETGPVYIGKNATVHENAVIKGPFAMLENSQVAIGSKIREATTIGPYCKVGGEVKNSVFLANSHKGHEGFVGNSVIGEWCNFGADSNTSNLKNNYQYVRLWHYGRQAYENTGLQFCGLMMGDHSKCSINTMFNTGTVVGVFANIFGTGFPAKFIPSFTWGGVQASTPYDFDKAMEVFERVLERKGRHLSPTEVDVLRHIFQQRATELPA